MIDLDALAAYLQGFWLWLIDSSPALGVLVAAGSAIIALRAILQAAKDSDHRTRPVVAAEFQLSRESDSSMDLVIRNYGLSMARDLSVTFDRPVTSTSGDGEDKGGGIAIRNRYEGRTFSVLSPGQEFRNTWWLGTSRAGHDRLVNHHDTPDEVIVTVAYSDLKGKRYSDPFTLHVDSFLFASSAVSSTSVRGRLGQISSALLGVKDNSKRMADLAAEHLREDRHPSFPTGETITNGPATMTSASIPQIPIFADTKPNLPRRSDKELDK
ncbi:hypothetical protein ABLI39_03955 [Pseudarthrobacter sp. B907]|uniref:hypothetical protein n=1 Tax=Pseudarthrobacter sp. B907 TaxID=3158261 RepID=UPI0032D9C520